MKAIILYTNPRMYMMCRYIYIHNGSRSDIDMNLVLIQGPLGSLEGGKRITRTESCLESDKRVPQRICDIYEPKGPPFRHIVYTCSPRGSHIITSGPSLYHIVTWTPWGREFSGGVILHMLEKDIVPKDEN